MVTYFGPIFRYKDTTAFGDILNKKRNDRHEIHGWVEVTFILQQQVSAFRAGVRWTRAALGLGVRLSNNGTN